MRPWQGIVPAGGGSLKFSCHRGDKTLDVAEGSIVTDKRSKPKADRSLLRISAAAEAAGVSKQTVEYYIMLGLISPIRRPGKRGRYFDAEIIKRIQIIRRLNETGLPLREIRETYLHRRQRGS